MYVKTYTKRMTNFANIEKTMNERLSKVTDAIHYKTFIN